MTPDDLVGFKPFPAESREGVETIKMAMADYDRVRPLIDGRVKAEGLEFDITTDEIRQFCTRPVYEEFDVAEMSMSWYVAARSRGEPCVALPVFPLRMPVLGFIYVHRDSPYTHPSELKGKRMASPAFRYTVNVWVRGILKEHYGLAPEDMSWVTNETETNGYVIPANVKSEIIPDRSLGQMLIDGEIDAIMGPEAPDEFKDGDPRIRRIFPDARSEQVAYFKKTGIFPITHTVVMHQDRMKGRLDVAKKVIDAFREAQQVCDDYAARAKRISLPSAEFYNEEDARDFGKVVYTQGVEPNRNTVETFVRYAHEQNYIPRPLSIEEFFAEGTLDL